MRQSILLTSVGRVLLLLLAYFFCRIFFLIWNWDLFSMVSRQDLLWSFVWGLRFDLAAIMMTNSPIFLLALLPVKWWQGRWLPRVDGALFAVCNFIAIGLNVLDTEFFKFIGKRSSQDFLRIGGDIERHSLSILATYWTFLTVLILSTALLTWLRPRYSLRSYKYPVLGRLALVALIVLVARGGFGVKPLHPMDAHFTAEQNVGILTSNSPFNMLKSRPSQGFAATRFFAEDREPIRRLIEMTELSRPPLAIAKNWNVVVLILESFGAEYTGIANSYKGYTPFFDELAKDPHSYYFDLSFANARRSIEGLPAILCGLPSIMTEPIITSDFSNNRLDCLPRTLGARGYETHFLHGAHNGSMRFDSFSRIAGFQNFVGLNEYPKDNPADLDPYWGVLDEPMLQYAIRVMDKAKAPFFTSVFTLSSHHPYYIPPQYKGRFPKGTLEIHESIGYADHSLRRFFEEARKRPWFNNTLFVVTADHTQKAETKEYFTLISGYRVPILLYMPGLAKRLPEMDANRIVQHIDIAPTIYDLLGFTPENRLLVGQSMFDKGREGRAYNYAGYWYFYLDPRVMIHLGPKAMKTLAPTSRETTEITIDATHVTPAVDNLKAVIQYLNTGLTRNVLYNWRESL